MRLGFGSVPPTDPAHLRRMAACAGLAAALFAGVGFAAGQDAGSTTQGEGRDSARFGSEEDVAFFRGSVRPLLERSCARCHGGEETRNGLSLLTREGVLEGGNGGPAAEPGDPDFSLLYEYVAGAIMPPDAPLAEDDVAVLREWIARGLPWDGEPLEPVLARAGPDWWSLQPVVRPPVPEVSDADWVAGTIDAFILARLEEEGLRPSPPADRRTYIRRVTFDLLGLPPTPEEVEAFVNDTRPDAYEQLVDRLLASPHYGERWARHWLDVVRFGESHGYEVDEIRETAWRYRDWVVEALNRDLPYTRFIREQLAADVLHPDDPRAWAATGFLVAGPYDTIGNNLQASETMRAITRQDELADMVGVTGTAFLGLTVGCARCHDHKFDPILQADYYRMAAVFGGFRHGERVIATAEEVAAREAAETPLREQVEAAVEAMAALDAAARQRVLASEPGGEGDNPLDRAGQPPSRPAVTHLENEDAFEPAPARWVRFTVEATSDGTQPCIDELEVFGPDEGGDPEENSPGDGREQSASGAEVNLVLASRGARATASSLLPGFDIHRIEHVNDGLYGNAHSWISNEPGAGWVAIELPEEAVVTRVVWGRDREDQYRDRVPVRYRIEVSLDGREWREVASSDGRRAFDPETLAEADLLSALSDLERAERERLVAERDAAQAALDALPPLPRAYCGMPGAVPPTYLLERGDVTQPRELVAPGAIQALGHAAADFGLAADAPEGERRRQLAEWIAHPENPLTARVIVNRLWHYHFGRGIVGTPSDFGFNGEPPSHPELLDWLADELRCSGWRLKRLHRLIVLSNTYRQSSRIDAASSGTGISGTGVSPVTLDTDNRLLWRYTPRRLDAESLRDAILSASGQLDLSVGGPSFRLFVYRTDNVRVFDPLPEEGPEHWRRTLYRMSVRTASDPLLAAFDCPDPSQETSRRASTTTPTQALALLNNRFVLQQAECFAERLVREAGDAAEQVRRAYMLLYARPPEEDEIERDAAFIAEHGLPAYCRVLFNTNEFLYVD